MENCLFFQYFDLQELTTGINTTYLTSTLTSTVEQTKNIQTNIMDKLLDFMVYNRRNSIEGDYFMQLKILRDLPLVRVRFPSPAYKKPRKFNVFEVFLCIETSNVRSIYIILTSTLTSTAILFR